MTHRVFSRNAASSRAIPTRKLIRRTLRQPAIPAKMGRNQSGMQAGESVGEFNRRLALALWYIGLYLMAGIAWLVSYLGVHKQWANRLIEPWAHITLIISATEWANFFRLRNHPAAQPEMQELARAILNAFAVTEPLTRTFHAPFINPEEWQLGTLELAKLGTARSARTSYLTHDGKRPADKDYALHDQLRGDFHMSPFEHSAWAMVEGAGWCGNFRDWRQYRWLVDGYMNTAVSFGMTEETPYGGPGEF